jgi:hypothetical protein
VRFQLCTNGSVITQERRALMRNTSFPNSL